MSMPLTLFRIIFWRKCSVCFNTYATIRTQGITDVYYESLIASLPLIGFSKIAVQSDRRRVETLRVQQDSTHLDPALAKELFIRFYNFTLLTLTCSLDDLFQPFVILW